MADTKVDGILLEIEATSDKADGGIDKVTKSLTSMLKATEGIDKDKLSAITGSLKELASVGEQLKNAGTGMRGIVSSIKSMAGIDSSTLKDVADTIEKIGSSLGNLGSNNKISIKIDSMGIKETVKSMEKLPSVIKDSSNVNVQQWKPQQLDTSGLSSAATISREVQSAMSGAAQSAERLSSAEDKVSASGRNAAEGQQAFNSSLNQTNASGANAKIQSLISQINQYKATIRGMESGKVMFDTSQYEEAVNGLRQVQEQFRQFKESITETPKTMEDISKSIGSIGDAAQKCGLGGFSSILSNIAAILPNIEMGGMAANAGFQSMAAGLQAVQSAIPIIGIILTILTSVVNAVNQVATSVKNAVQKVISSVKSVANKIRSAVQSIINKFNELKKKVRESLGFSEKQAGSFAKKLKSITRLFTFMLLRSAFTQLFDLVKNGFNNLVVFSKKIGTEFHQNINLLYNDVRQLGNSLATAFEPILNAVAPILDLLIQKLITATNALAQFFSALTGKSFYTKAIKQNKDYAESLNSAAKAAKNLTTGIDELNILSEDSKGSGGANDVDGSGFEISPVAEKYKDFADMIKDAWKDADFYDIGRMLGEKLKEALESIPWDKIKKTLRKIAKSIATFLNGFLETPGLFKVIGKTIAEGINSAFEFIDEFVWDFHWKSLGQAIIDTIQGLIDNLDLGVISSSITGLAFGLVNLFNTIFGATETWGDVGTTIARVLNILIHGLYTFVRNFDFTAFGSSIAECLGNALSSISYWKLGDILATGINGAFEALLSFAETFPWVTLATNITNGINHALETIDWETIKSALETFCSGLGSNLNAAITNIDWELVGTTFGNCINTLFSGIGNFLAEIDFEQIGNDIVTAINTAIDTIDWENAGSTINSLITGVCTLINTVINKVDWLELMRGVSDALAEVDWDTLLETVFKVFAAKWTFEKMFKLVSWSTIWNELKTSIIEGISGIFGGSDDDGEINTVGENIVSGLLKGIANACIPESLRSPLSVFGNVIDIVKGIFGIQSPSTVFAEIGENIVAGLKEGIENFFSDCMEPVKKWADNIIDWFTGGDGDGNIIEKFKGFGSDIVSGFKDKIGNTYTTTKDNVVTWGSKVRSWFTEDGGVNSRNFTTFATNIIDGFKSKVGSCYTTARDNIVTWGSKCVSWFEEKSGKSHWETVATNVVDGFKNKVGSLYTTCKETIQSWGSSIIDWFKEKLDINSPSKVFEQLAGFTIEGFANGISGADEATVRTPITTFAENIISWFTNAGGINKTSWETYAGDIVDGFKTKIGNYYSTVSTNILSWASNIKTWFSGNGNGAVNSSTWSTYAQNVVDGFKSKIGSYYSTSSTNITTWASATKTWFTNISGNSAWYDIASEVVNGFKNGIGALYNNCKSTIQSWASDIVGWFKEKLDINSPSKVFMQMGVYSVKGYNAGIEDEGKKTKGVMSSWADSFTDMEVNLGTRLRINDSALKDYQNNYGGDFTNEAIVQRVKKEVSTNGAVQATLNSGGGLKEAIKEALVELGITSEVTEISRNTKIQADKKEQTTVYVGNREVAHSVEEQKKADGYSFTNGSLVTA